MDQAKTSLTINFTNAISETSDIISISLDETMNVNSSGEPISTFNIPGSAYFLVFASNNYNVYSSIGKTKQISKNVPIDVVENISFTMSKSATLNKTPHNLKYEWTGKYNNTKVTIDNRNIILSKDTVGILKCSYKTFADRWILDFNDSNQESIEALVVALTTSNTKASLTINFSQEQEETDKSYDLEVLGMCSDEPLADTTIFLDGKNIGKTNSEGIIYLGKLKKGKTYSLKMTKEGYINSDLDNIKNDGFTIS